MADADYLPDYVDKTPTVRSIGIEGLPVLYTPADRWEIVSPIQVLIVNLIAALKRVDELERIVREMQADE